MKQLTKVQDISAAPVSGIYPTLDKIKEQIEAVAQEHNVSQVLMLVTLKDWIERQLKSEIDFEQKVI